MRLDDLVVLNPNIDGDYYPVTRAEVLQAALTEPCPDCLNGVEAIPNGIGDPIATGPCRTCGGRGWKAKKRVWVGSYSDDEPIVIFPAKWLEGDDQ